MPKKATGVVTEARKWPLVLRSSRTGNDSNRQKLEKQKITGILKSLPRLTSYCKTYGKHDELLRILMTLVGDEDKVPLLYFVASDPYYLRIALNPFIGKELWFLEAIKSYRGGIEAFYFAAKATETLRILMNFFKDYKSTLAAWFNSCYKNEGAAWDCIIKNPKSFRMMLHAFKKQEAELFRFLIYGRNSGSIFKSMLEAFKGQEKELISILKSVVIFNSMFLDFMLLHPKALRLLLDFSKGKESCLLDALLNVVQPFVTTAPLQRILDDAESLKMFIEAFAGKESQLLEKLVVVINKRVGTSLHYIAHHPREFQILSSTFKGKVDEEKFEAAVNNTHGCKCTPWYIYVNKCLDVYQHGQRIMLGIDLNSIASIKAGFTATLNVYGGDKLKLLRYLMVGNIPLLLHLAIGGQANFMALLDIFSGDKVDLLDAFMVQDERGVTALHLISYFPKMFMELISQIPASQEAQLLNALSFINRDGNTPLHVVAFDSKTFEFLCEFFMQNSAEKFLEAINIPNRLGSTPLGIAKPQEITVRIGIEGPILPAMKDLLSKIRVYVSRGTPSDSSNCYTFFPIEAEGEVVIKGLSRVHHQMSLGSYGAQRSI